MARRNDSTVKAVIFLIFIIAVIFSLYSYQDVHSRLQKSEERGEKLTQQHDSFAAQVQVLTEAKSRLEQTVHDEKDRYNREKQDIMADKEAVEDNFHREKDELQNRVNSLQQQLNMQQSKTGDLEEENLRLNKRYSELQSDLQSANENHQLEFKQLQQEGNNLIAPYRDQVADLTRKLSKCDERFELLKQQMRSSNPVQDHQKNQRDVGHKEQHYDADQNAVRSKRVQRLPAVLDEDHHQQQEIVEKEDEQMQINKPGELNHPGYHKVEDAIPDVNHPQEVNPDTGRDEHDGDEEQDVVHMQQGRPPQPGQLQERPLQQNELHYNKNQLPAQAGEPISVGSKDTGDGFLEIFRNLHGKNNFPREGNDDGNGTVGKLEQDGDGIHPIDVDVNGNFKHKQNHDQSQEVNLDINGQQQIPGPAIDHGEKTMEELETLLQEDQKGNDSDFIFQIPKPPKNGAKEVVDDLEDDQRNDDLFNNDNEAIRDVLNDDVKDVIDTGRGVDDNNNHGLEDNDEMEDEIENRNNPDDVYLLE